MKLGQLEIELNELKGFTADAKKSCYAGNGQEVILADGSKQLTFQRGNFHYTDNYAGYFQAPGTEIVRWQREDGQRIWQMSYSGGMMPEFIGNVELAKKTFVFLKEALKNISSQEPYRGPRDFEQAGFFYERKLNGDFSQFRGFELIHRRISPITKEIVFSQDFVGGLVIPK